VDAEMNTQDRPTHASEHRLAEHRLAEQWAAERWADLSPAGTYCDVRNLTEALAEPLSPEDQTVQSMPDVSPTKWHRAHTTWFFETFVLERFAPRLEPFDPTYRMLFNSYYEGVGPRYPRTQRGSISRPGAAEVGDYRRVVDARVVELIAGPAGDDPELAALVELGMHHEQQHQELLLMDVKHVLSLNPLQPAYRPSTQRATGAPTAPGWVDVDGGLVEVGHDGQGFCFDNESPRHRVYLEPFRLADRLVTCAEWQSFIADGGYDRADLWLSDGWYAVQAQGWQAPLYWQRDGDGWVEHTLGGTRQVVGDEPVCHVSHYEADAYARWAGSRLPTESEWEHAVCTARVAAPRPFDVDALHPAPAPSASLAIAAVEGPQLRQAFGECWQWTASAYLPYPGFAAAPGAVGEYNGKFMSGQMVLRGSSAFTPPGHSRATYRNFFPPHSRWPLTGVRLACPA
jgi:ergothioneine biosynthesis protein EgtB